MKKRSREQTRKDRSLQKMLAEQQPGDEVIITDLTRIQPLRRLVY